MSRKRPKELDDKIAATLDANNDRIEDAIKIILASPHLKPTIVNVAILSKVHENTVRNRIWVKNKLKSIKESRKKEQLLPDEELNPGKTESETSILNQQLKNVMHQNAMLYEEVLHLQSLLVRKDTEIEVLSRRLKFKLQN